MPTTVNGNAKGNQVPLGRLFATPGAMKALEEARQDPLQFFFRHAKGDWGEELCEEDRKANDAALLHGARLLSAYRTRTGEKLWVISEADRSATTILLPEEY